MSGLDFFARYRARREPIRLLTEFYRPPHEILEELRRADPDGHALLTEHLVIPRPTPFPASPEGRA